MGQKRRLIEKLRSNPNNVSYEELERLLLWCGFTCRKSGGSHRHFKRPGSTTYTVPEHKPVRKCYVLDAIEFVERYGDLSDD